MTTFYDKLATKAQAKFINNLCEQLDNKMYQEDWYDVEIGNKITAAKYEAEKFGHYGCLTKKEASARIEYLLNQLKTAA